MQFPKLPDWLIYGAVVAALVLAAVGRQERIDAPAPPPPAPEVEGAALGPASPFDPAVVVDVADRSEPATGTAFSVSASGLSAQITRHTPSRSSRMREATAAPPGLAGEGSAAVRAGSFSSLALSARVWRSERARR